MSTSGQGKEENQSGSCDIIAQYQTSRIRTFWKSYKRWVLNKAFISR